MPTSTIELDGSAGEWLERTRADLLRARHLPGYFYTSPEIFDFEVENIFMKDWLCVGRVEEFENPGDYHALRIAGEPVLICRGNDGKLNAFHNVCRHRGVEVVTGQGNRKNFKCPYHAWVYDLDGTLLGAPHTKEVEEFDFGNCGLLTVNVDCWGGYIFVNLSPDCQPLADYLDEDEVREFAGFLQPEDTRTSDKYVFELPCNWKFVAENLIDMYHVGTLHKDTLGVHFPVNDFRYNLTKYGFNATYEASTYAPGGATLFGPMPWLVGKVTERFACATWIRPTMNFFARHDMLQPWVALPIDVDRTLVTVYTQLPACHFEAPAFEEKNRLYIGFLRQLASEDGRMLASLQNAVKSRAFRPGPTVKLERAVHHLLNYYLDRLVGDDDALRQRRREQGWSAIREAEARSGPARDGGYSASFGAAE